ncbi:hypothetical protein TCAL_07977 [Tigriopus californicus]|uniref:Aminomethyltransferase, mitochondrial n=1 Tax=Tigriopus californicus TaxID=6832 RepID=A0A553N8A5_TIGCA|nr:hypothetical protein TCAL_07977 [Tigriopus californicus]
MFRFPKGFGHQVIALTRQYGSSSTPRATCLYDFHVAQGGKMVDFAGYLMPVQYEGLGIAASHLHTRQGLDVTLEYLENRGLIALQGPESARVLQSLCPQVTLSQIKFMTSCVTRVNGVDDVRITRCGYTGEDGFEISIQDSETAGLVEKLLSSEEGKVELAGLGARDSLRLEAGLCLYGNDIDAKTTPGTPVGEITSGCPSPSLEGHNVSMAYLPTTLSKIGTKVQLQIRKKTVSAEVVKMPFVPSNYYSS